MPKPTVGFCGLGAMGAGMATHLLSQGYTVKGFDSSPAASSKFQSAGGKPAPSLADSAQNSPFYILMVANSIQAQSAIFDGEDSILDSLPDDAVLCMCCTVSASYVHSVWAELQRRNRGDIKLVDCPVSGGAVRAAKGELTIMCGGKPDALELASPLLEELTDDGGLFIVEGGLGQGSNMKMCHQVLAAVQILATAEAYGFGTALGLDPEDIRERIISSDAWSWMFENRSPRTISGNYSPPASALYIITKDSSIVTKTARETLFPTPMTAISEQIYIAASNTWEMANLDDAVMIKMYTQKPLADYKCTLDPKERERRLQLVTEFMINIHIASASESIMLADHCNIPLKQFFSLVLRSAGNSRMFERFADAMRDDEGAEPQTGRTMEESVEWLVKAMDEACDLKIQLPLGNTVLNLFQLLRMRVGEEKEASNLLRTWE